MFTGLPAATANSWNPGCVCAGSSAEVPSPSKNQTDVRFIKASDDRHVWQFLYPVPKPGSHDRLRYPYAQKCPPIESGRADFFRIII